MPDREWIILIVPSSQFQFSDRGGGEKNIIAKVEPPACLGNKEKANKKIVESKSCLEMFSTVVSS